MPQYKIATVVGWETEADKKDLQTIHDKIREQLSQMWGDQKDLVIRISFHSIKEKKLLKHLAEFALSDIFPFVGQGGKQFEVGENVYKVSMNSDRYHLFKQNQDCVVCGIRGDRFILDLPDGCRKPHFNLYAKEDEKLILMTKDHIVPVSKGGLNQADNYQTMCTHCNSLKGNYDVSLDDIRKLRELQTLNLKKGNLRRRRLIKTARTELIKNRSQSP